MVFIKVDLDKLGAFIKNLEDWITDAESSRKAVRDKVSAEDPASIRDVVSDNSTMTRVTNHLSSLKGSLETRRLNVKDMNSNGVAGVAGASVYYLPDGVEDNTANVTKYNINARKAGDRAALELVEANKNGKSSKGRTAEQIIFEMKNHQDIPTYASAFFSITSPESYLDLMEQSIIEVSSDPEKGAAATSVFSHLFAAASKFGHNAKGMAEGYGEAVAKNDVKQASRIKMMNALLSCPTSPADYSSDFLVEYATRAENVDLKKVKASASVLPFSWTSSVDPLSGALNAIGRNKTAALNYFSPDGKMGPIKDSSGNNVTDGNGNPINVWQPGPKSKARWERINGHSWDREGVVNLSPAMKANSYWRDSEDSNMAARAAWSTSESINHAATHWRKKDYDTKDLDPSCLDAKSKTNSGKETLKENMAVVMGDCEKEIYGIANSVDPGEPFNRNNISTVLYDIMDNEKAISHVNAKVGAYSLQDQDHDPEDGWTMEDVDDKYRKAGAASGFLTEVTKKRMADNKDSNAQTKEMLNTGASVFSTLAGAAVNPALGAATTVATQSLQPMTVDEIAKASGLPRTTLTEKDQTTSHEQFEALAYQEMVNRDLSEGTKPAPNAGYRATDGSWKKWTDANGNVTLPSPYDDGAGGALRTWADGTHKHGFKQVKKSIGDGIDEGERNINDATDGSKHSNGALKINRN